VRGGLCRRCNTLLGLAKDDVKILVRAIEYLETGSKNRITLVADESAVSRGTPVAP
jgi:hypothetical protein